MPVVMPGQPPQPPKPQPAPSPPPAPAHAAVSPLTQEQFMAIIRWVLSVIGPILVARGYVADEVWAQVVGALIALAPLVWSMIVKTRSGIIASAAALPDVEKVVTTPDIANGTLRADPKVVSK